MGMEIEMGVGMGVGMVVGMGVGMGVGVEMKVGRRRERTSLTMYVCSAFIAAYLVWSVSS